MDGNIVILQTIEVSDWIGIVGLVFAAIGAIFALFQWKKGNDYKRAEIVRDLITKVRDDEMISSIMTLIDWSKWFEYDGEFRLTNRCADPRFTSLGKDELFERFDKTLSHYSYICYLNKCKCLSKRDMYSFEYGIKRLADNKHICNYLYSIYHWSKVRGSHCSFTHLINYCIEREWLNEEAFFRYPEQKTYECKLLLPPKYTSEKDI